MSSTHTTPRLPVILIVEPQFVLRRTIVALARDFGLGSLQEASSSEAAAPLLASKRFDGLVVDLTAGAQAFDLLTRLRASQYATDASVPVIGMAAGPRDVLEPRLPPLGLFKLLHKPFKVGELLQAMKQMKFASPEAAFAA